MVYHWTRLALSGFVEPSLVWILYCCIFSFLTTLIFHKQTLTPVLWTIFSSSYTKWLPKEAVGATIFNSLFMHSNLRPYFTRWWYRFGPDCSSRTLLMDHNHHPSLQYSRNMREAVLIDQQWNHLCRKESDIIQTAFQFILISKLFQINEDIEVRNHMSKRTWKKWNNHLNDENTILSSPPFHQ